jgi:hypothetical protein
MMLHLNIKDVKIFAQLADICRTNNYMFNMTDYIGGRGTGLGAGGLDCLQGVFKSQT